TGRYFGFDVNNLALSQLLQLAGTHKLQPRALAVIAACGNSQAAICVLVSMTAVIELEGLSVRLGTKQVLDSLQASLKGRAIGLLGPNGAGKSTLINTLLGFFPPSSGSAKIFGKDIRTRTQP